MICFNMDEKIEGRHAGKTYKSVVCLHRLVQSSKVANSPKVKRTQMSPADEQTNKT